MDLLARNSPWSENGSSHNGSASQESCSRCVAVWSGPLGVPELLWDSVNPTMEPYHFLLFPHFQSVRICAAELESSALGRCIGEGYVWEGRVMSICRATMQVRLYADSRSAVCNDEFRAFSIRGAGGSRGFAGELGAERDGDAYVSGGLLLCPG